MRTPAMSTHLSLQHAQRCIAAAIAETQRQRLAVCVAVVDAHANLLAFVRMDDSVPGAIDLAQRKARSAALFRLPSGELGRLAGPGQPLWSIEQSNGGLACFAGGMPLGDAGGSCLGGVGVSGASAAQDQSIAEAAVAMATIQR
ncbi:TPA: heme-binding protein [Pseudomonas aeruginosa]|nr:heme-binding protein [Pseudomonas aeruginosa]